MEDVAGERNYVDRCHVDHSSLESGSTHQFEYKSPKFKTKYTIEVTHRPDGLFQAAPIRTGNKATKPYCRISNGMDSAIRLLISEVLEKTSPKKIFAAHQ
jgi:hypothetical protein